MKGKAEDTREGKAEDTREDKEDKEGHEGGLYN